MRIITTVTSPPLIEDHCHMSPDFTWTFGASFDSFFSWHMNIVGSSFLFGILDPPWLRCKKLVANYHRGFEASLPHQYWMLTHVKPVQTGMILSWTFPPNNDGFLVLSIFCFHWLVLVFEVSNQSLYRDVLCISYQVDISITPSRRLVVQLRWKRTLQLFAKVQDSAANNLTIVTLSEV